MRIALGVEYDGRAFHGWQLQLDGIRTVQGELEAALSRVANHAVRVYCAGRTDTGVHGTGQVVHFESEANRTERNWLLGCNVNSPGDLNVRWVKQVDDDFHARFSATGRTYRYLILNRSTRSALTAARASWVHVPLDVARMQAAAMALLGEHDFSSYRAIACQAKSPVRCIKSLQVERKGNFVEIKVSANGFLHHMVRNIAGVLIAIGAGEREVSWAAEILAFRDRTRGGVTAAPDGLYFERVDYPAHFSIPDASSDYFMV